LAASSTELSAQEFCDALLLQWRSGINRNVKRAQVDADLERFFNNSTNKRKMRARRQPCINAQENGDDDDDSDSSGNNVDDEENDEMTSWKKGRSACLPSSIEASASGLWSGVT
jgi:hypothetical protein